MSKITPPLESCEGCLWKYPYYLLAPLLVQKEGEASYKMSLCGQCALNITNSFHRVERKRFHGRTAEDLRRQGLKWRKIHPEHAPVKV